MSTFEKLFENSGEAEERRRLNALMAEWCDAVKDIVVSEANGIPLSGDFFFVTDGFYPYYFKQRTKILFITREPTEIKRRGEGIGRNDYLELYYNGYRKNKVSDTPKGYSLDQFIGPAFHSRMLYMAYAILTDGAHTWEEDYPYSFVPWGSKIGEKLGSKDGISFAYMNLSKYSNDNAAAYSAHDTKLIKKFLEDSDAGNFVRREIALLEPDIIITGNLWKDIPASILDSAMGRADFSEDGPPRLGKIQIDNRNIPVIDLKYFSAPHGDSETYRSSYFEPVSNFLFWKGLVAPSGIKVDDITDKSVTLSWEAADNADGYKVYWDTNPAFEPVECANTKVVKKTSVEVAGLVRGTVYHFKVRALNSSNDARSWDIAISAKTTGTAPAAAPEPLAAPAPKPPPKPAPEPVYEEEPEPKKQFSICALIGWLVALAALAALLFLLLRGCASGDALADEKAKVASLQTQLNAAEADAANAKADADRLRIELEALKNVPPPAAVGLTYDDIHFFRESDLFLSEKGDSSEGDAMARMDTIAADVKEALADSPMRTVILLGFAANSGRPAWELTLSGSRATRVKKELVKRGIPEGNIQIVRGGSTVAWGDNRSDAGMQANRVVRILLAK